MNQSKAIFPLRILVVIALLFPVKNLAHCDGMDGPVVKAAQKALQTGNVALVLIWVKKQDEAEIMEAFRKTQAIRKLSPEAKQLADTYFFETVVRIHRAGEGAPYIGLKSAGRDLGPVIPAADKALEDRSADHLLKLLANQVENGVRERFNNTTIKMNFQTNDVEKGREYVKAYVEFVHYVESLYDAAVSSGEGHPLGSAERVRSHE